MLHFVLLTSMFVAGGLIGAPTPAFAAAPQSGPGGETCIKTGTTRRTGEDKDTKKKYDCLWDYCTYCDESGGRINCSIQKTSYSNPRDCKDVASGPGGAGRGPAMTTPGVLEPLAPQPATPVPPGRFAPMRQPDRMLQSR